MRIVVDTNIFISAALKDKSLPFIAAHTAIQHGTILKSTATEAQLFDVLARPYFDRVVATATRDWLKGVMAAAESVTITERIVACRDPTDDKFLELAVSGRADLILTGDNDLLVLHPFRDIMIVAPATFVRGTSRR